MGFAQEMKDFVSAAEKGWKMMTPTPAEVRNRELNLGLEQEKYRRSQFEKDRGRGSAGALEKGEKVESGADDEDSGGKDYSGATTDPVNEDLEPHEKALLNAIAGPESNGRYNVRYTPKGGKTFEETGEHPAIYEPTKGGKKSSAAGRYQFVKSTWDRVAGGLPFTRENQDLMALKLARQDYKARTGRDLDTELKTNGLTNNVMRQLAPTWAGFEGKGGQNKAASIYRASLNRYSGDVSSKAGLPRDTGGDPDRFETVQTEEEPAPEPPTRSAVRVPLPPVRPASVTPSTPATPATPATPDAIPVRRVKTAPASAVVVEPPPGTAVDSATGLPIPPDDPRLQTPALDRVHGRTSAIGIINPLLEEDPYLRAGIYAAKGGLVPSYADGGLAVSESAIDPHEMSDEDAEKYLNTPMDYVQLGARKGLDQLQTRFGLKSGAVPEESPRAQEGARALAANAGAPDPAMVRQLQDAADPEGKLSEDQRAVNGWANMIKYYTDRGNPQAVANAGAAMLMHSKRVSQQAGAMALVALEKGDFNAAAKAIQAAYNTFPNGESVRVNAAGDDGVEYEVVTSKGIKGGKVTPEELKELATGMMNGTQWFQHATQLTQGAKPADLKKQREDKARSEFEESQADTQEYLKTLSKEDQEKFRRMDKASKNKYLTLHANEQKRAEQQGRFDERNALQAEREEIRAGRQQERDAKKEDMTIFKEAVKQKRWDITRDQVMTNFERMAALRERDLSDRNTRHKESLEARQKRYAEIDQRIMERTRGIGAKGGEKETAKEGAARRERTAIEQEAGGREGAVTREMSIGDDGELVPSFPQRTAVSAIRGGTGFRHLGPKGQELPEGELEAITEKVGAAFKDESVTPADKLWLTQATADIRSSQTERFTTDAALDMIKTAVKAPTEPVVDPRTGMVTIRPDLPPVYLSERSIIALAQMRQRARETARPPVAAPAVPGVSAPIARPATGERAEAETRASVLRERQLRAELGEAYEPGMTIPEMEAAVLAERTRKSRSRRAIDLENWETRQREEAEKRRRQRAIGNLPR